jgi:hypothetical protein
MIVQGNHFSAIDTLDTSGVATKKNSPGIPGAAFLFAWYPHWLIQLVVPAIDGV